MACDCENKPTAAPEDSVRNAAALWVSAGKTAGFAEGVRYAVQHLQQCIPMIVDTAVRYELAKKKAEILRPMLDKMCSDLLGVVDSRKAESDNLNRMATMMAGRLEAQHRAKAPSVATRLRAALAALRG